MTLEKFSLEEYLKNPKRKVVTGKGQPVRIVCTDRIDELTNGSFPILGLVQTVEEASFGKGRVREYGRYFAADGTGGGDKLYFALPSKWLFLYHDKGDANKIKMSGLYKNKKDAEEQMKKQKGFNLAEVPYEEWNKSKRA